MSLRDSKNQAALALCVLTLYQVGCASELSFGGPDDLVDPLASYELKVNPPYEQSGNYWNTYIRNQADTHPLDLEPVYCNGDETGFNACIHVGELRKLDVPGVKNCDHVTVNDKLDAFHWSCRKTNSGITLFSTHLKEGRGLANLIDPDRSVFKPNAVTFSIGRRSYTTKDSVWWDNAIAPLPSNPGLNDPMLELSGSTHIYYFKTSRVSSGYRLADPNISIVGLKGARLHYNGRPPAPGASCNSDGTVGNEACLISSGQQSFMWLEGQYIGATTFGGSQETSLTVIASYSTFFRFHNLSVARGVSRAAFANYAHGGRIVDSSFSASRVGIVLALTDYVTVRGLKAFSNRSSGFDIRGDGHTVQNIAAFENGAIASTNCGGWFNSINGVLINGFFSGNRDCGLNITSAVGRNSIVDNIVAVNNGIGFWVDMHANGNTFSKILSTNNNIGVQMNETKGNIFADLFVVGHNSAKNCNYYAPEAENELETSLCTLSGTDLSEDFPGNSSAVLRTGTWATTTSSFRGYVTDDKENPEDDMGIRIFGELFHWQQFASVLRGWGRGGGGTFINPQRQSGCTTDCQIVDYGLTAGLNTLRDRTGNGKDLNGKFEPNSPCPDHLNGNNYIASVQNAQGEQKFYLSGTQEILFDFVGNDNGLCESGEDCLYSPNFGVDQDGSWSEKTGEACIFENSADGKLADVRIFKRAP